MRLIAVAIIVFSCLRESTADEIDFWNKDNQVRQEQAVNRQISSAVNSRDVNVPISSADIAQIADGATTIYGMVRYGLVESNDFAFDGLNGWEILAVKLTVTQVAKLTPEWFCRPELMSLTVLGYGASAWNLAVILIGTGWYGLPVAIALIVWKWNEWQEDARATCENPWGWISEEPADHLPEYFGDDK